MCAIRRAKLPDPAAIGNAGSFFKNPVVTPEQCRDIIGRDPEIVHYPMPDGSVKLAAAWMIDACGWKGKTVGQAGVYERQALVLVNRGAAIGSEVMTLSRAIQEMVPPARSAPYVVPVRSLGWFWHAAAGVAATLSQNGPPSGR